MTCPKCRGKGLLPFVKDGRIISHAFIDCECKQEEPPMFDALLARGVDLFDFPCSQTFRDYYEQEYYGRTYPVNIKREPPKVEAKVPGETNQFPMQRIDSVIGELRHLENQLNEHIVASKKAAAKRKSSYD